jgi:hypothetical protein
LLDLFYQFTCFKIEDHNFVGLREHSDQELVRVINLEIRAVSIGLITQNCISVDFQNLRWTHTLTL